MMCHSKNHHPVYILLNPDVRCNTGERGYAFTPWLHDHPGKSPDQIGVHLQPLARTQLECVELENGMCNKKFIIM